MKCAITSELIQSDRLRMTNSALDWITDNIESFNPGRKLESSGASYGQALGELAILCLYLRRTLVFSQDSRLNRCLTYIRGVYSQPTFCERMFRADYAFIPHLYLLIILKAAGVLKDETYFPAVQNLLDAKQIVNQLPHRNLELRYLLDLGKFSHSMPDYTLLLRRALRLPLNFIRATDLDVYHLTHALFHCSDFSFHNPRGISQAQIIAADLALNTFLPIYVRSQNWDLVGELLLSMRCLGTAPSFFHYTAWKALLESQSPDGHVVGPYFSSNDVKALRGRKRREYVFRHCYHTTLVAALTSGLCATPAVEDL